MIQCIDLLGKKKNLNSQDKENLSIAADSGEMLLSLINQSLDFAKLENGNLDFDY